MNNLAVFLELLGRRAEAEPFLREALERRRRVLGEDDPDTIQSITNLGGLMRAQGKLAEAYGREALEKYRRVLGEEHPSTLTGINNLGSFLLGRGKFAEAETYIREALEKRQRILGPAHPLTLNSLSLMGSVLQSQERPAEAESFFRAALEGRRRALGDEHADTLQAIGSVANVLLAQGRGGEALLLLEPAEGAARKVFTGPSTPRLASMLSAMGRARLTANDDAGRFKLAEGNLLEAHAILERIQGAAHRDTLACVRALVGLYTAWERAEPGQGAKAAPWQARLDAQPPLPAPPPR